MSASYQFLFPSPFYYEQSQLMPFSGTGFLQQIQQPSRIAANPSNSGTGLPLLSTGKMLVAAFYVGLLVPSLLQPATRLWCIWAIATGGRYVYYKLNKL